MTQTRLVDRPTVRLWLLSVAAFGLGTGIFDLLFNLQMLRLGIDSGRIGTLFFALLVVMAACTIPVGILSDRYGRRGFLLVGSFAFGLSIIALAVLTDFNALLVAMVVSAVGGIMMITNESPTIAAEVGEHEKARTFSLVYIVYLVTSALGSLIGGVLPRYLPAGPLGPYEYPLVIAGVLATGIGVLRATIAFRPQAVAPARTLRALVPTRSMLSVAALAFLLGSSAVLAMRLLNVVLDERFQLSAFFIGVVLVLEQGVSVAGASSVGRVVARVRENLAASAALILSFPLQVLAGLSGSIALFLPPFLARQALHYFQMPLLESVSMSSAPQHLRATMSSYRQIGFFLGSAIFAKVYGGLIAAHNVPLAFAISGALACAAGVMYLVLPSVAAPVPEAPSTVPAEAMS